MTVDVATEPASYDIASAYLRGQERLSALVLEVGDPAGVAVAPCPGWSVHDVVAHLYGIVEDVAAGRLAGPPDDQQTAEQVRRHRGEPTVDVVREWQTAGPDFAAMVGAVRVWPALIDLLSHEQDIRHALGDRGARDLPEIDVAARRLLETDLPDGMAVRVEGVYGDVAADLLCSDAPHLMLRTTAYETLRWRLGRRSRRQLLAMDWDGDPGPVVDRLALFGPTAVDIVE